MPQPPRWQGTDTPRIEVRPPKVVAPPLGLSYPSHWVTEVVDAVAISPGLDDATEHVI